MRYIYDLVHAYDLPSVTDLHIISTHYDTQAILHMADYSAHVCICWENVIIFRT